MEITVRTAPHDVTIAAEYETTWKVTVKQISPTAAAIASGGASDNDHILRLARSAVVAVISANAPDGPVGINGKPATDPGMLSMVLECFPMLVAGIYMAATKVEVERGNSLPAPVSL